MSKVSTRRDGQITDFYVDGKRYSLRYDADGNINKVLEMEFDENGNVSNQKIRNYNIDGSLENTVNYEYINDGQTTGQIRTAVHAKYGNPKMLMEKFFGGATYSMTADKFTDQKFDSDGRLTDFYYKGKRYSVRYDKNGDVEKVITQTFHENGNIASQNIKTMLKTGHHGNDIQNDIYKYNENGKQISHQGFMISHKDILYGLQG